MRNKAAYDLLLAMMRSESISSFKSSREEFFRVTENLPATRDYYLRNWDEIPDTWVKAYRLSTVLFLNNTNNNVESINRGLKRFIPLNSKINKCLEGILNYVDYLNVKLLHLNIVDR